MQYIAIIEGDDESGYSAYVPDLSGCIAAAETREEIPFHLEGMAEAGDPIPPARSRAITVDVHIPVAV
ncbi:MAG: type II toxin-antitoxin system HicB family antitoxin [Chloroflexota bacterium]|nr:type II toxin-antitoxin system HicB family antitoxin [Chloroflexota bacterium]